jgi:predicted flavoprotein YhiN
VEESLQFFNDHGLPTKVEAEKRAFPESNKASDVWKVMVDYLRPKKNFVEIISNSPVKKILFETTNSASTENSVETKRITGIVAKSRTDGEVTYTAKTSLPLAASRLKLALLVTALFGCAD